jgi:glutamate-ammonia-ligase adenylyltransferase
MRGREVRQDNESGNLPTSLFSDPVRSEKNLTALEEAFITSGSQYNQSEFSACLGKSLADLPDPDMALTNLCRFVEATVSKASLFNDLIRYPVLLDVAVRVFASSQYFSDILVRDPELFRWMTASDILSRPQSKEYFALEADRALGMFSRTERKLDALRRLYRREVLRIGARDLLEIADLTTTTRELSDLADTFVDASLKIGQIQLADRFGDPPPISFAVIGLGKLGGSELNYSSDIDIMFVYEKEGEKRGPGGKTYSFYEYFNRLAEKVVGNLSQNSSEGHIYRVDIRLRPESGAGPLARSVESYLLYYESRGELWERQMLIKARTVGGDVRFGRAFLEQLGPFVFPKTFFQSPLEAVGRIKARIESELPSEKNIKLMRGGIRDIEFIVQALQLLNGGRIAEVRAPGTLQALSALAEAGLLPDEEATVLTKAYGFFRTLEHRLQMAENVQTHCLPSDPIALRTLAKRMGFRDRSVFEKAMQAHLSLVRSIFNRTFSVKGVGVVSEMESILEGGLREEEIAQVLRRHGFKDPGRAVRNVKAMLKSSLEGQQAANRQSRLALQSVARDLFRDLAFTPSPDLTLSGICQLVSSQRFPEQFYEQLRSDGFRKLITRVCSVSPRFVKALARFPSVLDEIASGLGAMPTLEVPDHAASEQLVEFKQRSELRLGVLHVLGFLSLEELAMQLSATADTVISSVVRERSRKSKLDDQPLAIFALGKHGTGEILFDADIDLLFLCEARNDRIVANVEELAQKILRNLQAVTSKGTLYDIDVRLRPEGKSAPLVVDLRAYRKYLYHRASLWERQSLTRLRFVCGNEDLAEKVRREVQGFVYRAPFPEGWTRSIVAMRRKMESRSRVRTASLLDIKLGSGGMVDIEFTAQMLQLRLGQAGGHLGRKTSEILQDPAQEFIDVEDARWLSEAYRLYRETEKYLRITLEERGMILPEGERLDLLARVMGEADGEELKKTVLSAMRRARELFIATAVRLG